MKHPILFLILFATTQVCGAQGFLATDFGAVGDGTTLCTRSLQAAIDSANAAYNRSGEPQTVVLPAGRFVSGTLYLKSGVTLMLNEGATLLGSTNPFDYVKDPYCRWTAFVFAVKQHDIGISGKGTIDGRGWEVANQMVEYIHMGLVDDPLKYDRPNETNRPENIHFRECENIIVKGITLRNPGSWNQQYDQCRNLLIEDQTVDSKSYWNNDGVDIVDCSDVVIRNCTMDAADDVFCFKSHSVDGVCENVTVENCYGRSSANGIKFGTMTRGKFRHFRFRNIVLRDTYRSAITIASVDGATVEDIGGGGAARQTRRGLQLRRPCGGPAPQHITLQHRGHPRAPHTERGAGKYHILLSRPCRHRLRLSRLLARGAGRHTRMGETLPRILDVEGAARLGALHPPRRQYHLAQRHLEAGR